MVWTATGAPPPMGTPPTWICRSEAMNASVGGAGILPAPLGVWPWPNSRGGAAGGAGILPAPPTLPGGCAIAQTPKGDGRRPSPRNSVGPDRFTGGMRTLRRLLPLAALLAGLALHVAPAAASGTQEAIFE